MGCPKGESDEHKRLREDYETLEHQLRALEVEHRQMEGEFVQWIDAKLPRDQTVDQSFKEIETRQRKMTQSHRQISLEHDAMRRRHRAKEAEHLTGTAPAEQMRLDHQQMRREILGAITDHSQFKKEHAELTSLRSGETKP